MNIPIKVGEKKDDRCFWVPLSNDHKKKGYFKDGDILGHIKYHFCVGFYIEV